MYPTINRNSFMNLNEKLLTTALFSLISFAFILSDWTVLYSSIGDFLLIIVCFTLFIYKKIYLEKTVLILFSIPLIILTMNILLAYGFNDYWVGNRVILNNSIKFTFYVIALYILVNYIRIEKLKEKFLDFSTVAACIVVTIGVVITIGLYLELEEYVKILWHFTRQDTQSYLYEGYNYIIRTRSVFSEPAHLGVYLNVIFYSNIFFKKTHSYFLLSILSVGILLTFSYSAILTYLVTGASYLFVRIVSRDIRVNKWMFMPFVLLVVMGIFLRDYIHIIIIERTMNILEGVDGSAYNRIFESWMYIERERIIFGNGIGHTPPVTNMFAYALSDFGLIGFIPFLVLTGSIFVKNLPMAVLFIMINISKGGYLNPWFWMFLLFTILYGMHHLKEA